MTRVKFSDHHVNEISFYRSRCFPVRSPSSPTVPYLPLLFHSLHVEAEMFLTGSRPEYEGSVTTVSENKSSKTEVEAALRCEMTNDCRGMLFYKNWIVRQSDGHHRQAQLIMYLDNQGSFSYSRAPSKYLTHRWQKHAFFHANVNILSSRQNNRHFADDILSALPRTKTYQSYIDYEMLPPFNIPCRCIDSVEMFDTSEAMK